MKHLEGRIAVITGAASGIGRGIAGRCAQEGMGVVLADIEEQALSSASEELAAAGANVLAVPTDVSKASAIRALAQETLETFGDVHLLFSRHVNRGCKATTRARGAASNTPANSR